MENFEGRVAVITGAASGIGAALARRCAAEKMAVVLADVDEPGLGSLREELEAAGTRTIAVRTDVSEFDQVDALKRAALEHFGAVHLLFNNAGVLVSGYSWERSQQDWEFTLGVNLWGVIHGMRAFVPLLLEQGEPAHIVNTASIAGFTVGPMLGPYTVSKHGVVGLTETLFVELSMLGSSIGVSCVCPGPVDTQIMDAQRIRPARLGEANPLNAAEQATDEVLRKTMGSGIPAEEVANQVFAGIREERFWILTHPQFDPVIRERVECALRRDNPFVMPFAPAMD